MTTPNIHFVDTETIKYKGCNIALPMNFAFSDQKLWLARSQIRDILMISEHQLQRLIKRKLRETKDPELEYRFRTSLNIYKYKDKPFMHQFYNTEFVLMIGKLLGEERIHDFKSWTSEFKTNYL